MRGYKGFNKDLTCRNKQYEIGGTFKEENATLCNEGIHFCEAPGHVFGYYSPGISRYCEVEGEEVSEEKANDDSKRVCKQLKIGAEISASAICQIAVKGFFEWFSFGDKINKAKESPDNNAGDCGAANAGYKGAANAGYKGAANAGYCGAANAGNCGAANAGNYGAANAGDCGAANAGDYGAAIVGESGKASVGEKGIAISTGKEGEVKGGLGSLIVLVERDDEYNIRDVTSSIVDGESIKPDTWYKLINGELREV